MKMVLSNLKSRQQEEEEQLTENEKQRWDQLEKEESRRLQAKNLQQQSNTNTEKLTPEQEAEIVVAEVKQGLRGLFVKSEEFIIRLGNALKKVVKREQDICEEIKTALKDEIS